MVLMIILINLALNLRKSFFSMTADIVLLTKGIRMMVCFEIKQHFFFCLTVLKSFPTNKEPRM
jgi:hypothetical protein